jgi:hypothetical protein
MSYSSDPELDAQRHCDSEHAYSRRAHSAERVMSTDFVNLAMRGDAGAVADFAPSVADYTNGIADSKKLPKRAQRLHECLDEAVVYLEYEQKLKQLLINAALGMNVQESALKFIADCADKFAEMNVEVDQ